MNRRDIAATVVEMVTVLRNNVSYPDQNAAFTKETIRRTFHELLSDKDDLAMALTSMLSLATRLAVYIDDEEWQALVFDHLNFTEELVDED